jgi:acetamidase/formamidase
MTLAVHFDEIRPDHWGWTVALLERSDESMEEICLLWQIDPDNGTATTQQGHTVRIQPFMGVSGLAPAEPGQHATRPPRTVGGNMDCKELVAGSTLYLPVAVAGGLFSTGDGHALQGDGEVSGTAIECPMERVQITFTLLPEVTIETPYAETPTGFLTMGFSPDLNIATEIALHAMLDHLENRLRVSRVEALALASVLVDLRVTQIVNAVHGVHAFFPKDSLINL